MIMIDLLILFDALFAAILIIIPLVSIVGRVRKKTRLSASTGAIVHYQTGMPIPEVQVMVYRSDGKLLTTLTTNMQGEFSSVFPVGEYGITINAPGYEIASTLAPEVAALGTPYTGGTFTIATPDIPFSLVIPVMSIKQESSSLLAYAQSVWRSTLFAYRTMFWIAWIIGIGANSLLLVFAPSIVVVIAEILYCCAMLIHLFLQSSSSVAVSLKGQAVVRDSSTGTPLDLAVIRLIDESTSQLVATKISDAAGAFSLIPSPGTYRIEVTRDGYEPFSRGGIIVTTDDSSALEQSIDMQKTAVI